MFTIIMRMRNVRFWTWFPCWIVHVQVLIHVLMCLYVHVQVQTCMYDVPTSFQNNFVLSFVEYANSIFLSLFEKIPPNSKEFNVTLINFSVDPNMTVVVSYNYLSEEHIKPQSVLYPWWIPVTTFITLFLRQSNPMLLFVSQYVEKTLENEVHRKSTENEAILSSTVLFIKM